MIFPCMELFFLIFQVFHDFQSLWEPCKWNSWFSAKKREGLHKASKRPSHTCTRLYKSVQLTMDYSSIVCDPALQTQITALEQVQRRVARYAYNDYHSITPGCVTKMHNDLNWEPLEVRRSHEKLSMLYITEFSTTLLTYPLTGTYKSVRAVPEDQPNSSRRGFQISDATHSNSFFPRKVQNWR